MATQIVIMNNDHILIDDYFRIKWSDKGTVMPAIPSTIHCVLWNNLIGQNEIQNKDPSTGNMTGNTDLNSTSNAVGSTTIADLLTWGETRKDQMVAAQAAFEIDMEASEGTLDKSWVDYDPNYS